MILPNLVVIAWLSLTVGAASVRAKFAANHLLAQPSSLPSTTFGTIQSASNSIRAIISLSGSLEFENVTTGSHLLTLDSRDHVFAALRVDVSRTDDNQERIEIHQTFWGNEWGNRGELRASGYNTVEFDVSPERAKDYYAVRAGFSPLQFLKNPMILMALFSLVMIVGLPYLMNNMDEETRAEFEEMQRKSPVAQATSGGAPAALQNFDFAAWMAGRSNAGDK